MTSWPIHYGGILSDTEEVSWPPSDPAAKYDDVTGRLMLPSSPWTYGEESLNPELVPTNSTSRQAVNRPRRRHRAEGASSLPPYHPDYRGHQDGELSSEDEYSVNSSSDGDYEPSDRIHVRRGSEGYEVRPAANREDMLRRYLEEIGEVRGRYHRYIPQPDSESELEGSDNVPSANAQRHNGHTYIQRNDEISLPQT